MKHDFQNDHAGEIPQDLPILPLRNSVAYPFSVMPLLVGVPRSVKLVEEALVGQGIIGLVASRDGSVEEPQPGQTYEIGTAAKIDRVSRERDLDRKPDGGRRLRRRGHRRLACRRRFACTWAMRVAVGRARPSWSKRPT